RERRQHRQFKIAPTAAMRGDGQRVLFQRTQRGAHLFAVQQARPGQRHPLFDANKERHTQAFFQQTDLPRNGTFGHGQLARGQREALVPGRRLEGSQRRHAGRADTTHDAMNSPGRMLCGRHRKVVARGRQSNDPTGTEGARRGCRPDKDRRLRNKLQRDGRTTPAGEVLARPTGIESVRRNISADWRDVGRDSRSVMQVNSYLRDRLVLTDWRVLSSLSTALAAVESGRGHMISSAYTRKIASAFKVSFVRLEPEVRMPVCIYHRADQPRNSLVRTVADG